MDTVHKMFRHQPANVPPPASIVSYNTHQLTNHYRTIPRPPHGYDTHQLTNQYCMIPKLRAILLSTSHLGQKRPPPMPPTIVRRQRPLRSRPPLTPLTIGPISSVVKLHCGHNVFFGFEFRCSFLRTPIQREFLEEFLRWLLRNQI